jgi:poly(3-hydroxybutyrate) depolymerase
LNLTLTTFQATSHSKKVSRWLNTLLLTLLLVLRMTASAANWWCSFLRSFPGYDTATSSLTEVSAFGSNPGNLKMFQYLPATLRASRPLVVAPHGGRQQASTYDDEPGWIKLADANRFLVSIPTLTWIHLYQ